MNISFYKYQGTGNDFIIINNQSNWFPLENRQHLVARLCDRKFGVGADGLILLENDEIFDFKMVYFNANGEESTMCGNGGRCIVAFAYSLDMIAKKTKFRAIDGVHEARIKDNNWIELKMSDVSHIQSHGDNWILDTGSPHYVTFVDTVENLDVYQAGKAIRYSDDFKENGINVNFVEQHGQNEITVATYERGVEDETLSCGTGVTACALVYGKLHPEIKNVHIKSKGGELEVRFMNNEDDTFQHIWLCGTAKFVFQGNIMI